MSIAEKLTTIAENEQKVFEAGYNEGKSEGYGEGQLDGYNNGYDTGVIDGRQAEYDEFWDDYQWNGERIDYQVSFSGYGWNKDTFKPKYNIAPSTAYMMFRYFNRATGNEPIDLVDHLEKLGVTLDFSNSTSGGYDFQYARISRVGIVNLSKRNAGIENTFINCSYLETIEGLVFKNDGSQNWYTPFTGCSKLKNVNSVEGKIGRTANLSPCPLTAQSAINFINALMDYSGTSNEYAYTITFSSTTIAELEALGNTAPNGETWLEYVQNVLCWNV